MNQTLMPEESGRRLLGLTLLPSKPIALEISLNSSTVSFNALIKAPRCRTNKGNKISFPIDKDLEHE